MKLYVIGTSQQAQICPASQYVSGYHAELLLLDNGDMLLTDRGSKNGTYVNGKKLTPDKDVNVRRGDDVKFADATLDWSQIPSNTVDMTRVQEIRSIGSHYMNKIQLHGDHVSRFHATLKKMKDGKWYIQDHSMNGTKVNGSPIPKDQDFRIKRGDVITCAGVPVKNPIPPLPENLWGVLGGILGVAACIAVAVFLPDIIGKIGKRDKANAVVMLECYYHYQVLVDGVVQDNTKTMSYSGTGFFISEDGKLVTNLHIAKPWLYENNAELIKNSYVDDLKDEALWQVKLATTNKEMNNATALNKIADRIQVRGVLDKVYVVPNGKVYSEQNAIVAHVVSASENIDVDLAIVQLDSGTLPEGSDYVRISNISKSDQDLEVGDKIYTIGFPSGLSLQISEEHVVDNKPMILEAFRTEGTVIRSGSEVDFEHNAMTEGGSSGSPIFDTKGNVVGVNAAHKAGAKDNNYNIAIDACLIHDLLNKKVKF